MKTLILIVVFLIICKRIDTQFINNPSDTVDACNGGTAYFNWTFIDTATSVLFVEWKKNGVRIALEQVASGLPFTPESPYVGRLSRISNAQISLGTLAIADSGTYTSEVTYIDGTGDGSNSIRLTVYDVLNNKTEIDETSGILTPSFIDSSITYTWTSPDNTVNIGNSLTVTVSGNYTLCVSEGKAGCLNPTIDPCAILYVRKGNGLTTPLSTISSDMSTTVSEANSTQVSTSSGLSQEIVIISSIFAAGGLVLLIALVVYVLRHCRQKSTEIPAKNKENHFANKQLANLTKKDDLKSNKPRKSQFSEKRKNKQESSSLDKKKNAQVENFAFKDRMYQHYPQTTDYWNNCGNQHVFNTSHNEGDMMLYGNWQDNYLRPHSRPNNKMLYQSHYPEYPGHNEGMFQYYRADNLYRSREQQMYQKPYDALYDMHIIDDKQDDKRNFTGRPYEKNWDLLY